MHNPFYKIIELTKRKKRKQFEKMLYDYNQNEDTEKDLIEKCSDNKKVAVYTCIVNNYDAPQEPIYYDDNIDYIMYTDQVEIVGKEVKGWACRKIPDQLCSMNYTEINRYIKLHPFEFFSNKYDVSIYVDGNVKILSNVQSWNTLICKSAGIAIHKHSRRKCIYEEIDACIFFGKGNTKKLRELIDKYKRERFPEGYGLLECNILVTDMKSETAKNIYNEWWDELIISKCGRDQVILPYVCWKNGIKIDDIGTLGFNVYKNKKIRVCGHNE